MMLLYILQAAILAMLALIYRELKKLTMQFCPHSYLIDPPEQPDEDVNDTL